MTPIELAAEAAYLNYQKAEYPYSTPCPFQDLHKTAQYLWVSLASVTVKAWRKALEIEKNQT